MSRDEVFRATGPTSSTSIDVKIGMKKDGTMTAGFAENRFQGGAFPGSPVDMGAMCSFAPYALENVMSVGYDVITNRPKQAAYRAPGSPMAAFAVESVVDMLCNELGLDPIEVRLKNASREGTKASYGPRWPRIGLAETLEAAKGIRSHETAAGPEPGARRVLRVLVQPWRRDLGDAGAVAGRHRRAVRWARRISAARVPPCA